MKKRKDQKYKKRKDQKNKKRKDQKETLGSKGAPQACLSRCVLYISINARSLSTLLKNKKFKK
jgi:hypothetical protein